MADVAKVRHSNLFLWPLDLFLLFGKSTDRVSYGNIGQKLYIFHFIKQQKDQFFTALQKL